MKKFLVIILLLGCVLLFGGCGTPNYSISKKVEIVEEVTYHQMKEIVDDVEIDIAKYVTMELKMTKESLNGTENLDYVVKYKRDKGVINGSVNFDLKNYSFNLYIKENVIYVNHDKIAKKIASTILTPSGYDFDDLCMDDKDYEEILEGFLENISPTSPNFVCGYDKKGNLIIEYITNDVKFRFVASDNKPLYLHASTGGYSYDYKFSYDKPSISKHRGFKESDYTVISWKEYIALGL